MKRIVAGLFILLVFGSAAFAQQIDFQLKTVELFSSRNADGSPNPANAGKSCFSFITESISCGVADLHYGISPYSKRSIWFQAGGAGTRNKIESLGKKNWTDDFKVPVVEPYAKLAPNRQRDPFLDASVRRSRNLSASGGTRNTGGASSFDDRKGTFRDSKTSTDLPNLKPAARSGDYFPFEKVALGNMYVMRVVDESNDFYVLFRVDELERGKRVKISWKRIPAPQEN